MDRITFETETRYYSLHIQPDLFGGFSLICQWGGKFNRRKGSKVYFAATLDEVNLIWLTASSNGVKIMGTVAIMSRTKTLNPPALRRIASKQGGDLSHGA